MNKLLIGLIAASVLSSCNDKNEETPAVISEQQEAPAKKETPKKKDDSQKSDQASDAQIVALKQTITELEQKVAQLGQENQNLTTQNSKLNETNELLKGQTCQQSGDDTPLAINLEEEQVPMSTAPIIYIKKDATIDEYQRYYDYYTRSNESQSYRINNMATYEFTRLTADKGNVILNRKDDNLSVAFQQMIGLIKTKLNQTNKNLDLYLMLDNTSSFGRDEKLVPLKDALKELSYEFSEFSRANRQLRVVVSRFHETGMHKVLDNDGQVFLTKKKEYKTVIKDFIKNFKKTEVSPNRYTSFYPLYEELLALESGATEETEKVFVMVIDEASEFAQASRPKNVYPISLERLLDKYEYDDKLIKSTDWFWTVDKSFKIDKKVQLYENAKRRKDERNELIEKFVQAQDSIRSQDVGLYVILQRR